MIDIMPQIIRICGRIPGIDGRVYRGYPQAHVEPPYMVVSPAGNSPELTDSDGSIISAHLAYTIDILARSQEDLDKYRSSLADRLARYNLYMSGLSDTFESSNHTYRISATFDGLVDRRGHTYR